MNASAPDTVPAPRPARERTDALQGPSTTSCTQALDAQLLEELAGIEAVQPSPKEGYPMARTKTAEPEPAPQTAPQAAPDLAAAPGLPGVRVGKVKAPQRTLVYGIPGVGKSTFAGNAPDAIFIPTEDGLDHLDVHSFPRATKLEQVEGSIQTLLDTEHAYRTVVIDSVDWLERLIHAAVCADQCVKNIEEIGYGKGYAFALTHWRHVLAGLDALKERRRMQVILVAHSAIEKFSDPTTDSYDRYSPRLHKSANAIVQEWCDNILFATIRVSTRTQTGAFNKTETKAIDADRRVLKCTPRPMWIAKNRVGAPDEIPLDYLQFSHHAYGTPLDE